MKEVPEEPKKESRELSWDEAQAKIEERLQKTVDRTFELGEETKIVFTVRALTPEEASRVESVGAKEYVDKLKDDVLEAQGVNVNFKKKQKTKEQEYVAERMKIETLLHGITKGPEGWVKTENSVRKLPFKIKNDLSDTIDELSKLNIETEEGFRTLW